MKVVIIFAVVVGGKNIFSLSKAELLLHLWTLNDTQCIFK